MALTSFSFLLFLVVVVLLFQSTRSVHVRAAVLALANLAFIASFVHDPLQLVPLAAFVLLGFVAYRLARPGRPLEGALWLAAIVLVFVYLKKYAFIGMLPPLPFLYLSVGLSYILFRLLQLVIDKLAGDASQRLSSLQFFNYTCNFLSFISGPIQRSGEFMDNQATLGRPLDEATVFAAFKRIILGYLKVSVVSAIADYLFAHARDLLQGDYAHAGLALIAWHYSFAVLTYTAYLYYNFAGYMDIVIGAGLLLGQVLPENFDHPFRARNLFEFWSRWHMTLSEWFKTYLFNPLLGTLANHVSAQWALPYIGVLAFFVTFFVMGVWHGSTLVFVLYGLVMGAGVSVCKVWQIVLGRRLGKKRYKALCEHPAYAEAARGITVSFFAIAVTALWVDFGQLKALAQHLGVAGLVLSFVGIAVAAALVLPLVDRVSRSTDRIGTSWQGVARLRGAGHLALASQILFILAVTSFFHKAPEFVYKAF